MKVSYLFWANFFSRVRDKQWDFSVLRLDVQCFPALFVSEAVFSPVHAWHLQKQLAEDAEFISGTAFDLMGLSICNCADIAPFLTIAQWDVLKSGTITLQLCPFQPRLFGLLCFRISFRISFLKFCEACLCCFNEGYITSVNALCGRSLLTMVLSVCEHGRSFHLSVSSDYFFKLCNFHWRVLSLPS